MTSATAVILIPRSGSSEWFQQAVGSLPTGTPYIGVEYDVDRVEAVNHGVAGATTDFVFLMDHDGLVEKLDWLEELAWDCDVTYGVEAIVGDKPRKLECDAFCANRLQVESYLPQHLLVRRSAWDRVGGMQAGPWETWRRLVDAGARFKAVPEATYYGRVDHPDESPAPTEPELKATFYYQATPATAYWRCVLPARYLPGQAVCNLPEVDEDGDELILPHHRGAAVIQFPGAATHYLAMRYLQKEHGARVLIEVDDNYLTGIPHFKRVGWKKKIAGDGSHSKEGHRLIARDADGVIVTAEPLRRAYKKVNENVYVCANQIDPSDWPELDKPDDGVFRIGWFASASHQSDQALVVRAMEWASRQPNVEVWVMGVGVTNGRPWWPSFEYFNIPWSNDPGVYRKFLMKLDVGLAPIVPNPWSVCRSDLKALEYAMAGVCPVLSSVEPYDGWSDGEGCLKAQTPQEFLRTVQWLVRDKDLARQLAMNARARVLANRTMQGNIAAWREAIAG